MSKNPMIRINLLKNTIRKKATAKEIIIPKPLLVIIPLLIIGVAGYFGWKSIIPLIPKKSVSVKKENVVTSVTKPAAPVHTGPNMIEEVVREIGEDKRITRSGILMIPYSEMTFPEKVNYEVLFAKTVFQLLSRTIPAEIGLKNLEIDNFQTIYAVGIGDTKEIISSTFNALKNERLELLQKPYSYITSNANTGYRFVVTCKTNFGLDHADPFQAWDYIGNRDNIVEILKKINNAATDNKVILKGKPVQVSAEDVGLFRRYSYHFNGNGEYKDFVAFIILLYKEKVPCAFKKVQLKAGNASLVVIDFDLLLTVKE